MERARVMGNLKLQLYQRSSNEESDEDGSPRRRRQGRIEHASTFQDTALFDGVWGVVGVLAPNHRDRGVGGGVVCSCPGVNRINFHIVFDGFYILFRPINRKT